MQLSILSPRDYGGLPVPGKCKRCGSVDMDRLYLDTGVQEEFYGAVLFCNLCFSEMAALFGFISSEKANELKTKVEEYYFVNRNLHEKMEGLKGAINGLVNAGYRDDSIDVIKLDLPHLNSLVTPESPVREETVGDGERTTPKSFNVEDVAGISATGSGQQSFGFGL